MAVQVIGSSLITSDRTRHQARCVGEGNWVVSYLPGRTLTCEQSVAAIRVAEEVTPMIRTIGEFAGELGLTAIEAVGMAARECQWPAPEPADTAAAPRRRRGWLL
jgi:hypothetical protein